MIFVIFTVDIHEPKAHNKINLVVVEVLSWEYGFQMHHDDEERNKNKNQILKTHYSVWVTPP